MSWGYKNNKKGQGEHAIDRLIKVFENESTKVYSSKDNLYYGGKITIRIIFIKSNIKVVLSGIDAHGDEVKPLTKDVTELKYLKHIKNEILNNLIDEFYCISNRNNENITSIENVNIETLNNNDFINYVENFFENIKNIPEVKKVIIWNKLYNDMFNRTFLFTNSDISAYHEKYLNLI